MNARLSLISLGYLITANMQNLQACKSAANNVI